MFLKFCTYINTFFKGIHGFVLIFTLCFVCSFKWSSGGSINMFTYQVVNIWHRRENYLSLQWICYFVNEQLNCELCRKDTVDFLTFWKIRAAICMMILRTHLDQTGGGLCSCNHSQETCHKLCFMSKISAEKENCLHSVVVISAAHCESWWWVPDHSKFSISIAQSDFHLWKALGVIILVLILMPLMYLSIMLRLNFCSEVRFAFDIELSICLFFTW